MAIPIYIPIHSAWGPLLSTRRPALVLHHLSGDGHSRRWQVTVHGDVNPHLPNGQSCWASVMCLLTFHTSSLEKHLFQFFAHFSIGLFGFFAIELRDFFIFFGYWPIIRDTRLADICACHTEQGTSVCSASAGWAWPLQGCVLIVEAASGCALWDPSSQESNQAAPQEQCGVLSCMVPGSAVPLPAKEREEILINV